MAINLPTKTIDLPTNINTVTTTITMTIADFWKMTADLQAERKQVDTLTAEKNEALLLRAAADAHAKLLSEKISTLEVQIALLTHTFPPKPPTIPNPIPRALIINKTEITGVAALTIEKGKKEPSDAMYSEVRDVMVKAKGMGFNAWRGFFNEDEVREHQTRKASDPKHLPEFGRTLGLDFIADTVDAMLPKLDINGQREYLKGLEAMGAQAVVFNDANQYETLDLVEWTDAVRRVLPNMPIIASLTGVANIAKYPMFDFFEAQTFGNVGELENFIERPFDIFCLDARKAITAEGITTRAAAVLAAGRKVKAFFYYADLANDWLAMGLDKQNAIRKMIANWKAAR